MARPGGTDARLRRGERFRRTDYRCAFAEGKSFPSRSFVGWILERDDSAAPETPKLGVVVSRRTFPLSVERNRAKRLMREAFRLSKGCVRDGVMVLLIGRRRLVAGGVKSECVAREFRAFCRKCGIARKEAEG